MRWVYTGDRRGIGLDKVVRQDLTKAVTFELKPEQKEREHKSNQSAENVSGRKQQRQSPEAEELGMIKVPQLS